MRQLQTYSIETDQVVLLEFTDGRRQRVPVSQLAYHLMPSDLHQVEAALKLRHHFLRSHMPKAALALAAGGALGLFMMAGRPLASLWTQPAVPPVQEHPNSDSVARLIQTRAATPVPAPTSSPPLAPTPAITASPVPRAVVATRTTKSKVRRPAVTLPLPTPLAQIPQLVALPTPLPGDVLGEATGPDVTPTPVPSPTATPTPETTPVPSPPAS